VVEAEAANTPAKNVRVYDIDYRRQIEKDIADRSVEYIKRNARNEQPFFLLVGWTRPHYPNVTHPDFVGKSRIGQYGDSVMELDYRTGQVLDAIRETGIEDNTIVFFLSDNGPQRTTIFREDLIAGSSGQFRGELFDPYEGGIRTAGVIRWPGKIRPGSTNAMISLLDIFPTVAGFVGGTVPQDRPFDGVDYSQFFLGRSRKAPRESLITFIGDRVAAVRWRQWRLYPRTVLAAPDLLQTTGVQGIVAENSGYPAAYNIEWDPREEWNLLIENSWLLGPYMKVIQAYLKTLEDHPNPPAPNFTKY
jgi:arylsulfatase